MQKIAQVLKSNGTDGELLVSFFDIDPEEIDLQEPVFIYMDGLPVPFYFESFVRRGVNRALVHLTGVHSLHFSFNGSATDLLFNWDWWQFNTFDTGIESRPTPSLFQQGEEWYDISGRRLPSFGEGLGKVSKGIYIRGHKKYVIR